MERMKELYEKVAGDAGLQAKFAEIMSEADKAEQEATKEKLTAFGKEAGYEVGIEEMRDFFKTLVAEKEGQLSDMELDAVAGGKSLEGVNAILLSVVSIGLGCAVGSAVVEAVQSGGCGRVFQ